MTTNTKEVILSRAQMVMGKKGFSAVGLNEILSLAEVPKGSFYHYFSSKEEFGVALLERYFESYLADIDGILAKNTSGGKMLIQYFSDWLSSQSCHDVKSTCLVVKLSAEVSDLSEPMRRAL